MQLIRLRSVAWWVGARSYLLKHTITCWDFGFHSFLWKIGQSASETAEEFQFGSMLFGGNTRNAVVLCDVFSGARAKDTAA